MLKAADLQQKLADAKGWLHTIGNCSSIQPWLAFLGLCHLPAGME
jgi:hypothetical protein